MEGRETTPRPGGSVDGDHEAKNSVHDDPEAETEVGLVGVQVYRNPQPVTVMVVQRVVPVQLGAVVCPVSVTDRVVAPGLVTTTEPGVARGTSEPHHPHELAGLALHDPLRRHDRAPVPGEMGSPDHDDPGARPREFGEKGDDENKETEHTGCDQIDGDIADLLPGTRTEEQRKGVLVDNRVRRNNKEGEEEPRDASSDSLATSRRRTKDRHGGG